LAGLFFPANRLNASALVAQGDSKLYLRLESGKKFIGLCALLIASQVSIAALAWSQVVTAACAYGLSAHFAGRISRYPLASQLRDLGPAAGATAVMVAGMLLWGAVPSLRPVELLAIQVTSGLCIYVCACRLMRLEALEQAVAFARTLPVGMSRPKPSPAA
jgi:O-antigen/teichoic acid export membrane protein